jgi:predicted anti-sigma-YlaC factor YlaD
MNNELTCQELVELVTDYLEGSMSVAERARFDQHLAICAGCRNYLDQMRKTIRTLGQLSEQTISAQARDDLLNVFRSWKAKDTDA